MYELQESAAVFSFLSRLPFLPKDIFSALSGFSVRPCLLELPARRREIAKI